MNSNRFRSLIASVAILLTAAFAITPLNLSASALQQNPCSSGEKWIQPNMTETQDDGGQLHDYLINGQLNQVPVPPKNFNPAAASDNSLAKYGFPERPTDPKMKAEWDTLMSEWRPTADLGLCVTQLQASISNDHWAGYLASGSTNLIAVQGDFKQPTKGTTSCSNSQEVSWVGIGGYNTGTLLQAGTGIDTSGGYYAFYEYLGTSIGTINVTKLASVLVHAGDSVHSYVVHQTSGSGQTTFYVQDGTSGTSQSMIVNVGSSYDGSTVEWIDERPLVGGQFAPLTNFGTVNWTNAQGQLTSGTWLGVGSLSHNDVSMYASGVTLAAPSTFGSTSFTDNWYRCS